MTRFKLGVAILSVLAAVGVGVPAQAALISGTINGTIASGTDRLNLFGGGDLTNDAVALSYSYDSSLFKPNPPPLSICGSSDACNISRTASALTLNMTINGTTKADTSGPVAEVDFFANGPTVSLYPTLAPVNGVYNYDILNFNLTQFGSINQPPTANLASTVTDRLSFTVNNNSEYLTFKPLTATSVSAVPLPASLPMFGAALIGLGLAGYGVRRRSGARRVGAAI